ncbi:cbb3-type cytochrome c oxidase subunit I [Acetobacter suratthaniensis]|uniref:Cytochrome C oxidase subunit I n=1 Tax=Acetobacter suratthaniensis TaxID=1502841 RepID=A0ABS3LJ42_9PROT|nr:cbb3-type cytochrome c oxidase subunit I [Acetobacter suratthaniensis]MBO1327623.1 cytochrome C oxidase subunit I [Acetobacter suratthaniensis]MCX2565605.1 cbb3-type cytochrome c oxidase subunit I [Acetobacter suratthaniensis]
MTVVHAQNPHAQAYGSTRFLTGVEAGLGAGWLALAVIAALVGGGISAFAGMGTLASGSVWAGLEQAHPILMLLYVVVPAMVCGFGTLWLPGALQRAGMLANGLNLSGLGLVTAGMVLTVGAALSGSGLHGTGATIATLLWCVGTLLACMALLVTIFDSRADSAGRSSFSPFVWGEMLSAAVLLLAVPVFAAHLVRQVLTSFGLFPVATTAGVETFAGPIGLVVLLAGFGVVFEMSARIGRFSEKPVALVMAATAGTGLVAWAKADLASGAEQASALRIGAILLAVCTFSAVSLAGLWLAGTWRSRVSPRVPLLWGMGFLVVVSAGWVAQLVQGAGLHSALQLGALYAVCGGFYLWRGQTGGFWYPRRLARLHFVLTVVATALVFVPGQQALGSALFGLSALCFLLAAGLGLRYGSVEQMGATMLVPVQSGETSKGERA